MLDGVGRMQTSDEELLALRDKAKPGPRLRVPAEQSGRQCEAGSATRAVARRAVQQSTACGRMGGVGRQELSRGAGAVDGLHRRRSPRCRRPGVIPGRALAFAKLSANAQAADYYNTAILSYADESTRIDESIAAIRNGKLLDTLLTHDRAGNQGWFWRLENLPQAPGRAICTIARRERIPGRTQELPRPELHAAQSCGMVAEPGGVLGHGRYAPGRLRAASPQDRCQPRRRRSEKSCRASASNSNHALSAAETAGDVVALGTAHEQEMWSKIQSLEDALAGATRRPFAR